MSAAGGGEGGGGDGGDAGLNAEAVKMLLKVARSKIEDAEPTDALSALLHAIRLTQGEAAIIGVLEMAKQQAGAEMEEGGEEDALEAARRMSVLLVNDQQTMLYERGDEEILRQAFEDGSSVVCTRCNALVPRSRFTQHQLYWCEEATGGEDDML